MKINITKHPGGTLTPASEMDSFRLQRFTNGAEYPIEMKQPRNPLFHKKVMAFFRHCFAYWRSDREFMNEGAQFDGFRNNLTVLAGYREEVYKIDGSIRVEAKSLSYGSMEQLEFEEFYQALIQAAMHNIFINGDKETYDQLAGFF
jgi:hypothetical protein